MAINKSSGNMYDWTNTWNPIGGFCKYNCIYCYGKKGRLAKLKKYQGEPRLIEKELKVLKSDKIIFVGSMTDIFGEWIPSEIIRKVLEHCRKFPENTYLFQSKNPKRFFEFIDEFPEKCILGSTIETNRIYASISKAPSVSIRIYMMQKIPENFETMISIEPIMDLDVNALIYDIRKINPKFVSIGADSKNSNLPEPNPEKTRELIKELNKFTKVKIKSNLNRILNRVK